MKYDEMRVDTRRVVPRGFRSESELRLDSTGGVGAGAGAGAGVVTSVFLRVIGKWHAYFSHGNQ